MDKIEFNDFYKVPNIKFDISKLRLDLEKVLKKKNEIKPWETLIVSDNLSWNKFSKVNNHLYDLNGVKPSSQYKKNYVIYRFPSYYFLTKISLDLLR